jgi:Lrp/AsnC family leucine-responsive transcriptional regulator
MEALDETDLSILRHLQSDSHLTTKELAAKVHLSSTPVFERVRRLEREGYIRRYVALLDADKLDKGLCIFCNVKLKQHNCGLGHEFMDAIQAIDEVTECYNISGEFDYMLKIYVRSMKHYQDFVLNTLGKIPSVGSIQSDFVMSVVKYSTAIPI